MISQALQYLSNDVFFYTDMTEPIRRGTAEIISAGENGVLLIETISRAYMLAADTAEEGIRLLSKVKNPKLASIHRMDIAYEVSRLFGLPVTMECHTAVWTGQTPPKAHSGAFDVRVLNRGHIQLIADMYSHPGIGPGYIDGRIMAGEMIGAFVGDELAGFIGLHEEGSMGMLEVARKFRRQGVASSLLSHLCAWLLSRGRTPFSQFATDNEPSRRLHEHMGFRISNRPVYWLENR